MCIMDLSSSFRAMQNLGHLNCEKSTTEPAHLLSIQQWFGLQCSVPQWRGVRVPTGGWLKQQEDKICKAKRMLRTVGEQQWDNKNKHFPPATIVRVIGCMCTTALH